jgi:hypothetical protein
MTVFRWWGITFIGYMLAHVILGTIHCMNEFCPGDMEQDFVYTYEDETTGQTMIYVDGHSVLYSDYKQILQENGDDDDDN